MQIRAKLGDRPHEGEAFSFRNGVVVLCGGKETACIGNNPLKNILCCAKTAPIPYTLASVRTSVGAKGSK